MEFSAGVRQFPEVDDDCFERPGLGSLKVCDGGERPLRSCRYLRSR